MSSFPPDPCLSRPNGLVNVAQRFPSYVFPFHPVLFIKEQFFFCWAFVFQISYPLLKYPDKSFTLSVEAAFTRIQTSGYLDIRMSEIRISSERLHVLD